MTIRPADIGSTEILLLAKLATTEEFTFPGYTSTFAEDRSALDVTLLQIAEHDLLAIGDGTDQWVSYTLTGAGRALAATVVGTDLPFSGGPADPAQHALWLWLLTHGVEYEYLGSANPWGRESEVLHLLRCGLDHTASTTVRDDTWLSFANTFADEDSDINASDTNVGVSGAASCRCGAVADFRMVSEVATVTDLLREVIALYAECPAD